MTLREKLINEIDDFQLALGPMGDLEYRKNDLPRFVEAASEEWIDVLIDIAQNPSTDERFLYGNEEFWSDLSSVTSDILHSFPQNVHKVAPLLENQRTRVIAFSILCETFLPAELGVQALDLIEPLVERVHTLSPDEICNLVRSLSNNHSERAEKMIDEILLRVPDYPLPRALIDNGYFFPRRPYKTLYEMVDVLRSPEPDMMYSSDDAQCKPEGFRRF